ncbi:hypothetical protein POVWA1_013290 [Plasmodium ovale wallikeri]|uniref:Uncharacterized protein n=1 Tax=Plasmodium ovale wallikeri TaxID=864142 RepID=A0A1A8YMF0_PLAOA|nr:hypothetical protein POVWA1_013290 [Plasmodium ovale wallikeri]
MKLFVVSPVRFSKMCHDETGTRTRDAKACNGGKQRRKQREQAKGGKQRRKQREKTKRHKPTHVHMRSRNAYLQ